MSYQDVVGEKKRALVQLVTSIFDQVDELSALRKGSNPARLSAELLAEMCSILPDLDSELQDAYLELLVKLGSLRPPPVSITISDEIVDLSASKKRKWLSKMRYDLAAIGNQ